MTDWETPRGLFEAVAASYGPFTVDVAATPANAKAPRFYSPAEDGLAQSWAGERVWLNPPYGGRLVRPWLEKARLEAAAGATVVCLLPFAPDTGWWAELVLEAGAEVRPVRGRVRFVGSPGSAPFASAIVVYRPPLLAQAPRSSVAPAPPLVTNFDLFPDVRSASGKSDGIVALAEAARQDAQLEHRNAWARSVAAAANGDVKPGGQVMLGNHAEAFGLFLEVVDGLPGSRIVFRAGSRDVGVITGLGPPE